MSVSNCPTAVAVLLAAAAAAPAADLNANLPEDTTFVVSVNVRDFLDAPLIKAHLPALLSRHGVDAAAYLLQDDDEGVAVDEKARQTLRRFFGDEAACRELLDEFKDRVTRMQWAANDDDADDRWFLALEGTFDPAEFQKGMAALEKSGWMGLEVKRLKAADREFYCCKIPHADGELCAALIDAHTLVVSTARRDVEKALSREKKGAPAVRKELADLAAKADDRGPVWFALAPKTDTDGLKTASGGVAVAEGVRFLLTVAAKDEAAAADLADDVKRNLFVIPAEALEDVGKAMKKTEFFEPLTVLLKRVEPAADKTLLRFELTLPAEALERVMKALP